MLSIFHVGQRWRCRKHNDDGTPMTARLLLNACFLGKVWLLLLLGHGTPSMWWPLCWFGRCVHACSANGKCLCFEAWGVIGEHAHTFVSIDFHVIAHNVIIFRYSNKFIVDHNGI